MFTGTWTTASGESITSTEPATGEVLARVASASAEDVSASAAAAGKVQRDWSARSHQDRARVQRRAGQFFEEHRGEIETWVVRESGAIAPFAEFQAVGGGAEECYEAAAVAAAPFGEVLRSVQHRLSWK